MKSRVAFAPSLARFAVLALLAATLASCGGRHHTPPLTDSDRLALDNYEQIRAALATDDARAAKKAAAKMVADLTPADPKAPAPPLLGPATGVAESMALDTMRQRFETLSDKVVPMVEGVSGYYIITCDLPNTTPWVQKSPEVDNPFLGKVLHWIGDLKK